MWLSWAGAGLDKTLRPTHVATGQKGGQGGAEATAKRARREEVATAPQAGMAAASSAAAFITEREEEDVGLEQYGELRALSPGEQLGAFPQPGEYDPRRPSNYEAVLQQRLQRRQERARRKMEAGRALEAAEKAEILRQQRLLQEESHDSRPAWMKERDSLRDRALRAARAAGLDVEVGGGEGVGGVGSRGGLGSERAEDAEAGEDMGAGDPDPMAIHVAVAIAQASNISPTAAHIMLKMGFKPGKGLGRHRTGMVAPLRHQMTAAGAGRLLPSRPHVFVPPPSSSLPDPSPRADE